MLKSSGLKFHVSLSFSYLLLFLHDVRIFVVVDCCNCCWRCWCNPRPYSMFHFFLNILYITIFIRWMVNLSHMQKKLSCFLAQIKKNTLALHLTKDCNKNTTLVNGTRIALTCVTDYSWLKSFFFCLFVLLVNPHSFILRRFFSLIFL